MAFIIVDNSVLAAHFLPDEDGTIFEDAIAEPEHSLIAPAFLVIEFNNVIVTSRRRNRLTSDQANTILTNFDALPIHYRADSFALADLLQIHHLAVDQELSFYDAIYLQLALQESALLATLDNRLQVIARSQGVPIYPLTGLA